MLKLQFGMLLLFPVLLCAAPGSIYGKALQRARNVSGAAQKSRTLPPEPAARPAAPKTAGLSAADVKKLSAAVAGNRLKRYPKSGAAGINELLAKKIITPKHLRLAPGKRSVSEKTLKIAWFGAEAGRAKGKGVFPLFFTKPAHGPVWICFTNGKVIPLKSRPRTVTGVISILRSTAENKKSAIWENYLRTARRIDRASK